MSLTAHCHCQAFVLGSRPSGPRRPPCHPQGTLPDPSLSYGHHDVKAKKEIVLQRGGAPGRPVGRPASTRRAAAWRPQTGRPTGRAAAPRTLRPGRRGPQRCGAPGRPVGRPTSGSRRRAAAWRQQTGLPTGRAAAPRTLCPGRRGPARCAAAPRNTPLPPNSVCVSVRIFLCFWLH
jgi:hypothetical protein